MIFSIYEEGISMKKRTFLQRLKKRLEELDPTEVEDIISEYSEYIDEKIQNGATEEDAVASFGEVNELSEELLRSYRRKMKTTSKDPIGDFTDKVMNTINKIINDIEKKSPTEIVQFIIEICLIILLILLCRIPISILIHVGKDVFNILSNPLNRIGYFIWKLMLDFAYAIFSIVIFVKIFEKRYLKKEDIPNLQDKSSAKKEEKNIWKEEPQMTSICETIIKIFVFFLKFIATAVLFAISCYLLGMVIILGICIYLIMKGVTYYGIYAIMLALFLLGTIFFSLLYNFVIDKKTNGVLLAINTFITILLLGGGVVVATFEVSETEFINGVPNNLKTESLVEELTMTKDTVFIGNVSHYNIDNSLNTVVVEYMYYPLGTTMSTDVRKEGNFVYLRWNMRKINISMDLLNHMINDLKEKKVYNYYIEPTIMITSNEENIARIRKNRAKYYENEKNYNPCNFVRTYTVEMVRESQEKPDEYIVVLSEYLEDDLETIHLKKELASSLEVGSAYEFTFQTYEQYIDTDIEDIFTENEIVGVKKTDKQGIEQRQDYTCTLFY